MLAGMQLQPVFAICLRRGECVFLVDISTKKAEDVLERVLKLSEGLFGRAVLDLPAFDRALVVVVCKYARAPVRARRE